MNVQCHIVKSGNSLEKYKESIEAVFLNTISKISSKVPLSDVDVMISDDPKAAIPEIGICGRAENSHLMHISLDPASQYLQKNFTEVFGSALAHELHHCMRWRTRGREQTLLEAIVSEGLADYFAIEITDGFMPMWMNVLTEVQIKTLGEKAKKEYHNINYDHALWFFGSNNSEIPRWTGYSLGFHLVKKYFEEHPNKTSSDIYGLPAGEFIRR